MASHRRIKVYKAGCESHSHHLSYSKAKELVERGLAEFRDENSLLMLAPKEAVAVSCYLKTSTQRMVYESAGITKYRQYVNGGLQRTEKNPAKYIPFRGAKVGHQ